MARRRRYHLPGATYHVMLRGNAGECIFFCNEDRCHMCLLIQEGIERYGHRVLGFCFMTNHLHLAIQVGQNCLSQIMQNLAFRYARYINWKHKRIGHLFQGRFKAVLVDSNSYLKELVRYIHLNPVRAGIVEQPEDYKWSSHNAYLGNDPVTWITPEYLLSRFSDIESVAIQCFHNFVTEAVGIPEEIDFKRGSEDGILGNDNFVALVKEKGDVMPEIALCVSSLTQAICEHYRITESIVKLGKERQASHVRGILALMVRESSGLTLKILSEYLGNDANTLGRQASRLSAKALHDDELRREIAHVRDCLAEMSYCPA